MKNILVNTNKYNGKYVALKSFKDNTIVGVGNSPEIALKEANKKGDKEPVIIYIAEKNLVHIYDISL